MTDKRIMKKMPWLLLALTVLLIVWLLVAIVHAENQRNALMGKTCADPVVKGNTDMVCLASVQSRDHWWQHLVYALRNAR